MNSCVHKIIFIYVLTLTTHHFIKNVCLLPVTAKQLTVSGDLNSEGLVTLQTGGCSSIKETHSCEFTSVNKAISSATPSENKMLN